METTFRLLFDGYNFWFDTPIYQILHLIHEC